MSYYFREKPRFGERFRGKSGDELLQELKQQFGEDSSFFDTPRASRTNRDPFERHTSFRGFPFDDEGFGRRADIRSHLDDLAARHPEFADQLLGPPWADVPFPGGGGGDGGGGGGLLNRANRNRRSSGGTVHNLPEEDTRSQASSQGSGEVESERKSQRIPQYGLRNTLDIGQHQHSMENPQQQRNVRSMSAPPENRNNQGENIGSQHPGHRFVSRVDITPQGPQQQPINHNQQHQRDKSPAPTQKPQPQSQQQGNVRHIPIFVEGRDEPVLAKTSTDEPDYPKRQQSPPQFHRPSHYQQHYEKQHPSSEWTSHFQDPFFKVPNRWGSRTQQSHQPEPPQPTNQRPKPQPQTQPQHKQQQQQQHQHHHQQQHPQQRYHQPQQQSEVHQEASPKLKQTQPKDPFERVAMVQKEVDSLTDQVRQYGGGSRQDKQYMYLDEMLTRELIKLDDIETEGKENVRQARKQAIKSIQDSIGLLESKAPLPGQHQHQHHHYHHQQQQQLLEEQKQSVIEPMESENKPMETMETSEAPSPPEEQKAIPLPPPSPPSPTKTVADMQAQESSIIENSQGSQTIVQSQEESGQNIADSQPESVPQDTTTSAPEKVSEKPEENQRNVEPTENSTDTQLPLTNDNEMEVRQSSPEKELFLGQEGQKANTEVVAGEPQTKLETIDEPVIEPTSDTTLIAPISIEKAKKEPPPVPAKPNKSKKVKKLNQQSEPVSDTAIPLPAPGQTN